MMTFTQVISMWPNMAVLAEEIGAPHESVKKWKQRDHIPAEWWSALLKAAKKRRYRVRASELIELAAERR